MQTKKTLAMIIRMQTIKIYQTDSDSQESRRIRTARCLYLGYFVWRPQHMWHIVPDLQRHFVVNGRKISSSRPDIDWKIFFVAASVPGGLLEECS